MREVQTVRIGIRDCRVSPTDVDRGGIGAATEDSQGRHGQRLEAEVHGANFLLSERYEFARFRRGMAGILYTPGGPTEIKERKHL